MVPGPVPGTPGGGGFETELLALALSTQGAVGWTCDVAEQECTWAAGMDDLLGMPGAVHQDVRARLLELIEPWTVAAEATGVERELELEQPVVNADGQTRFLRFDASALGGQRRVLIGLVRDVTGLHRDRQSFRDLAERYRFLVELSPDAICVHQDDVIKYANPAMGTLLGTGAEQLLGRRMSEFVEPRSVPAMRERIRSLNNPGEATPRSQAALLRVDGTSVPVELVSVRTVWQGRRAQQVIGRDVTAQKEAESVLRFHAALVEHVNNAIISTDQQGVVTSWNPAAEAMYGVTADQALGRPVAELVGAVLQPEVLLASGGHSQVRHRHRDGAALAVRVSVAAMDSGFVLVCADETARRRAEQEFATVVEALDEGVVVVSPAGTITSANPAAERILGAPGSELVGSSPESWPLFDETGAALRPEEEPARVTQRTAVPQNARVVRFERPDGRTVWLSVTARVLNPQDRPPAAVVVSFTDITESRAIRERLEHEATHDPLTVLANRTLVLRHLAARSQPMAVLFLDLDNFKIINDSLGHAFGDEVLRTVGQRLAQAAAPQDLVGRLGGDEFVVVHHQSHRDALDALAERLFAALTAPISAQGRDLHVHASIGITVSAPGDPRTGYDLLRDADVAMYQAKTKGGGHRRYFDVELREDMQRHLFLEQELRHAVPLGQLWVAYQPIVDLRTERTVAVEGLLRWTHPVHGTVSPGEFIPLAEGSDLINLIGEHMLRMATRQLAAERERHQLVLRLNVNLSPRQLDDPHLVPVIQSALDDAGLPAHTLSLEITESAIMHDPATAAGVLRSLRELGMTLAIDDFGTGHSSLAQLRRLPADTLKIDRSFVTDLGEAPELETIVASIIAMAHAVGLDVVAEGIETSHQLAVLRSLGCDHGQGYYLGKPAPIDELFSSPR